MRNIRMIVSYDGSNYQGFQVQLNTSQTIQAKIEEALSTLSQEKIEIIASGRTDAGVHAIGQVFNFHTTSTIPIKRWAHALNGLLPTDIVALSADEVPPDFHSRMHAKRKTYRYTINNNRRPLVLYRHCQLHIPYSLDWGLMQKALAMVEGEHDFTSFCSVRTSTRSRVRTIYDAHIEEQADQPGVYHIYMTGNGFLYNMVRIIAGTLIRVGAGKLSLQEFSRLLSAKDRESAGMTAPSHGLVLWRVDYD